MNIRDRKITVGNVVANLPESKEIFKRVGIDFCCGGHRLLINAMEEENLDSEAIYTELEKAHENRISNINSVNNIEEASFDKLTVFIENKHHGYLREALPEGLELLNTLVRVHGTNHKELFEIYQLYGKLKTELEQHLLKEEMMLFPELLKGEDQEQIKKLSYEVIEEHEGAGEILKSLRKITKDYTVPSDGCTTYRKSFAL